MLIQLATGRTIELSAEHYLSMSDDMLNQYMTRNMGIEVNDPFALSVLRYGFSEHDEEVEEDDEVAIELPDADYFDKIQEVDYQPEFD
jgi:hypothetical protein